MSNLQEQSDTFNEQRFSAASPTQNFIKKRETQKQSFLKAFKNLNKQSGTVARLNTSKNLPQFN